MNASDLEHANRQTNAHPIVRRLQKFIYPIVQMHKDNIKWLLGKLWFVSIQETGQIRERHLIRVMRTNTNTNTNTIPSRKHPQTLSQTCWDTDHISDDHSIHTWWSFNKDFNEDSIGFDRIAKKESTSASSWDEAGWCARTASSGSSRHAGGGEHSRSCRSSCRSCTWRPAGGGRARSRRRAASAPGGGCWTYWTTEQVTCLFNWSSTWNS